MTTTQTKHPREVLESDTWESDTERFMRLLIVAGENGVPQDKEYIFVELSAPFCLLV